MERALSLDPDLAEGHAGLALIQLFHDWDWNGAEASVRRALELAPGDAEVLRGAGELARTHGRTEEAIEFLRRALEQDPLSASAYHALATALYYADRFTESEVAHRKALELAPQGAAGKASMSMTLLALGRGEEALTEAKREPTEWARLWALAIIHHAMGQRADSDEVLRELIERRANDSAAQIAEVYAARGESNAAFEWLERAYAQRDSGISDPKPNPLLRSLHDDPRWGAFLKKMGFEA